MNAKNDERIFHRSFSECDLSSDRLVTKVIEDDVTSCQRHRLRIKPTNKHLPARASMATFAELREHYATEMSSEEQAHWDAMVDINTESSQVSVPKQGFQISAVDLKKGLKRVQRPPTEKTMVGGGDVLQSANKLSSISKFGGQLNHSNKSPQPRDLGSKEKPTQEQFKISPSSKQPNSQTHQRESQKTPRFNEVNSKERITPVKLNSVSANKKSAKESEVSESPFPVKLKATPTKSKMQSVPNSNPNNSDSKPEWMKNLKKTERPPIAERKPQEPVAPFLAVKLRSTPKHQNSEPTPPRPIGFQGFSRAKSFAAQPKPDIPVKPDFLTRKPSLNSEVAYNKCITSVTSR